MEQHLRILELGARGALPDSIDECSELPISIIRELVEAGYLAAIDASSKDGIAYLDPRITLTGREYLRQLRHTTHSRRPRHPSEDARYDGRRINRRSSD